MSKTILIIGGTGLIGQTIYRILSERNPNVKTLIGTRKSNLNPNEIQIGVNNLETFKSLNIHNLDLIVVCTKDTNNSILHYATQHKIDYKGQSELTAFSTVLHVEKMRENSNPSGIYFSYQLHEPKQFIGLLTSNKSIKLY